MKTKPQCTTQAECHRKYADWLEACEGTEISPLSGVKYRGRSWYDIANIDPSFASPAGAYEIAIGVLDGKIVWRDSMLYDINGKRIVVGEFLLKNGGIGFPGRWSWNPPRQTITINGKEVVKQFDVRQYSECCTLVVHSSTEDAQQFRDALK